MRGGERGGERGADRGGVAVLVLAMAACGRIGFDEVRSDAGGGDAPPVNPAFVISRTRLTSTTGFAWVAVDVDWPRKLAYLGSREPGRCVSVADFRDELQPTLLRVIDPTSSLCLDVQLVDDRHLVAIAYADDALTTWDLGADPYVDAPIMTDRVQATTPRHLTLERAQLQTTAWVVGDSGAALARYTIDATSITAGPTWPGTCSTGYQAVAPVGQTLVVGCSLDNSPIELLDRMSLGPIASLPNALSSGTAGTWTSAVIGTRAYMLGWANMVVDSGASVLRWASAGYRAAHATDATTIWTATTQGDVEQLSFATPGTVTARREPLGAAREAYGIRIAPDGTRGIVVTNGGDFVVIDPRALSAAPVDYPLLP